MIKLKYLLLENVQLAKKIYLNSGLLSEDEFKRILSHTNGDYTTKVVADIFYELKSNNHLHILNSISGWHILFEQLYTYNKNYFPIEGFSFDSSAPSVSYYQLDTRRKLLDSLKDWKSWFFRNIKDEVRMPRKHFSSLLDKIEYINNYLSYLNNRSEEVKLKIFKKIFSSQHNSIEDIINFLEDKPNLLYNKTYTKDELYKIIQEYDYDLNIVYDKGKIVIVDVTGVDGIKKVGCNSLWCFTYGSEYGLAGEQWDRYSYNGHVYAIIDFSKPEDDPEFIHILTKPLDYGNNEESSYIYNMSNEEQYGNPTDIILHITNDRNSLKVLKFEDF